MMTVSRGWAAAMTSWTNRNARWREPMEQRERSRPMMYGENPIVATGLVQDSMNEVMNTYYDQIARNGGLYSTVGNHQCSADWITPESCLRCNEMRSKFPMAPNEHNPWKPACGQHDVEVNGPSGNRRASRSAAEQFTVDRVENGRIHVTSGDRSYGLTVDAGRDSDGGGTQPESNGIVLPDGADQQERNQRTDAGERR